MAISGISHVTFIVRDVERAAKIWVQALGAEEVYDSGHKTFSLSREKFFVLGGVWVAIMQGVPDSRSYRHIAFQADILDLIEIESRLRAINIEIKPARPRVSGEGQSLYFYDFDDNLIELHAGTLQERLHRYKKGRMD